MDIAKTLPTEAVSKYVTEADIAERLTKAKAINKAAHELNKRTNGPKAATYTRWFARTEAEADPVSFERTPDGFLVIWSNGWHCEYLTGTSGVSKIRYSRPDKRGTYETESINLKRD